MTPVGSRQALRHETEARRGPHRFVAQGSAIALLLLALVLHSAGSLPWVSAHSLMEDELDGVGFLQRPGEHVPVDAVFRDEAGRSVVLSDYLGQRPVILTLNYLSCPNLCPLELQALASSLNPLPYRLGEEFEVLTVSIDERDTPELAALARTNALRAYDRPQAADGWHILTGAHSEIDRLTEAVGFQYAYDADQNQFAHPAGLVILTSDGRISRYLYGLTVPPNDLRLALVEAAQQRIGSVVDQVLLRCYRYDAQNGRYTPIVMNVVRGAGIVTILALGTFLGLLWRRDLARLGGTDAGRS